jgi:GNAT superfamily N-acetyltransferase
MPTDDILIRPAQTDDAAEAARLICASICELCQADHGGLSDIIARWTANKTPGQLRRWTERGSLTLFVAFRGGQMQGVGATFENSQIALNYVAPEARFSGVSAALLAAMEERLTLAGARRARLTSTLTARAFYIARGWRPSGDPVSEFGLAGFPMEKALQPVDMI